MSVILCTAGCGLFLFFSSPLHLHRYDSIVIILRLWPSGLYHVSIMAVVELYLFPFPLPSSLFKAIATTIILD